MLSARTSGVTFNLSLTKRTLTNDYVSFDIKKETAGKNNLSITVKNKEQQDLGVFSDWLGLIWSVLTPHQTTDQTCLNEKFSNQNQIEFSTIEVFSLANYIGLLSLS